MRKRLSILLALLGENEVLILDEPFSGLDMFGISEVSKVIRERAEVGVNMIIVSHMWKPIYDLVENIIVLVGGEVTFAGKKEDGIEFLRELGI